MRTKALAILSLATMVPASLLLGRGGGVISGKRGMPIDVASAFPSCGTSGCHSSFPNFNVDVAISGAASVSTGAPVPMTVTVAGANTSSTRGGFVLETARGSFTAGTTTRVDTTSTGNQAITHANSLQRSWSFSWTAPTTPGLVSMFAVANAANGDGRTSGDAWGWHGPDANTPGTAHRVFVNGANVTSAGTGCDGKDGFQPLLGMKAAPALGQGFTTEAYNLPTGTASIGILGLSNTAFGAIPLPFPLLPIGGGNCVLRVSLDITQVAVTGGIGKGDGTAVINWAIPNNTALRNLPLHFQQMTVDPAANSFGFSFSNALSTSIQ